MLMHTRAELEPVERLRATLPDEYLQTFELIIGTVQIPPDQPRCADAVATLFGSLVQYAKGIRHVRAEFRAMAESAQLISEAVIANADYIQGRPPTGQMIGRVSQYAAWALLSELSKEQIPLLTALGAEIAIVTMDSGQVNQRYCENLRRDANKYGRPQNEDKRHVEDLEELKFGRHWLGHFRKVDRQVRRRVELPDPDGPSRPNDVNPAHCLDLLARLRWRFEYPDPKHRQATLDDSHLTKEQFQRVALAIRNRVDLDDSTGIVEAVCLIIRFTPDLASSIPIIKTETPFQILGLHVERGAVILDLRALFPNRKSPPLATKSLFHESKDFLVIPLPEFLARALRLRMSQHPAATLLGDLTGWAKINNTKQLIDFEECKLRASLARASKSTGALAIKATVDRLVAAGISWDFSLIGSARMYYARLTGLDIHAGCSMLYQMMGWDAPALNVSHIDAAGSRCVLNSSGVQRVFLTLERFCNESWPGRRSNYSTLLAHHEWYTRYTVALISFCMGLREVRVYRLLASELMHGQTQVIIHDKQGGDRLMAQPAVINGLVREQIRLYFGHCKALHKRLERMREPNDHEMVNALGHVVSGRGPLFILQSPRGCIRPAGSHNTWSRLPEDIRVPANVGRHYWQNVLREHGLSSRDIDRFMRHRVVGMENNTSSQVSSPARSLQRIADVQVKVLNQLGISAIRGLRKV